MGFRTRFRLPPSPPKKTSFARNSSFFIQADRLGISSAVRLHLINTAKPCCISSHRRCVCCRLDDMQCFALMICNLCEVDDIQLLAKLMIYNAHALIIITSLRNRCFYFPNTFLTSHLTVVQRRIITAEPAAK